MNLKSLIEEKKYIPRTGRHQVHHDQTFGRGISENSSQIVQQIMDRREGTELLATGGGSSHSQTRQESQPPTILPPHSTNLSSIQNYGDHDSATTKVVPDKNEHPRPCSIWIHSR